MNLLMRTLVILSFVAILLPCGLSAANDQQISAVRLFVIHSTLASDHYVEVHLSSPCLSQPTDLAPANIEIVVLPSKKHLTGIVVGEDKTHFLGGSKNCAAIITVQDDSDNKPVV